MAFYSDREAYNRTFCIADADIAHLNPVEENSEDLRQSFFRINDVEELLDASVNWIHFPCMVMLSLSGMDVKKGGSKRQINSNSLMILSKKISNGDDSDATAISNAYDSTFSVISKYKNKLYEEEEEDCHYFEVDKVKWDQVGPIADNLYGWILTFTDETKPDR